MIIDKLKNINIYKNIHPNIDLAIDFINNNDLLSFDVGVHEIKNKDVFAIVSEIKTIDYDDGKWEVHREYIDIQCILDGHEGIGYAHIDGLVPSTDYNADKDIQFLKGTGTVIGLSSNDFMLLYPHEAHMPKIRTLEKESTVKKMVIKVKI